jgi:hypothetical protein
MAEEVEREVIEDDDVEGQRLPRRVSRTGEDETSEVAERLPRMSQGEDDVEGQMYVRNRNR